MVRRITIAIVVFILISAAGLWVLTILKSISASALGPHTPDPGKGRILFHAGGCASVVLARNRRTRPGSAEAWRLGRRLARS
jgi:hypothetical protein